MIHHPKSYSRLLTCHADLIRLVVAVAAEWDILVICGHRGQDEQEKAVLAGRSKVHWPKGRHNKTPSEAVDLAPFPLDWDDVGAFDRLGAHVKATAGRMEIPVVWGGDWVKLRDRPHVELKLGEAVKA